MATGKFQSIGPPPEILVFVDLPEGELDDYGKGILSEASRLAKTLSAEWSVLCLADASDEVMTTLAAYGARKLILLEGPEDLADSLEVQGRLIALVASERESSLILLPHNDLGGSLAPLLAAELDAALFTEAIAYRIEAGYLNVTRQLLGAQVAEAKIWDASTPLVLSINPRVLSSVVLPGMASDQVQVENWPLSSSVVAGATHIVERIPADPQTVDVSEAEVLVSVGLGCSVQGFTQVEELTQLINVSLGVTRPAYDLGYTDFERMVGQTGKTVAPRLYLALGISGSMHHIGGIKDSKRIVSVNIDPKAPIIAISDEAFVADLREVMPLLIERVKSVSRGDGETGGAA
ncbi:MAG: electron transfer flavoprotein subunit alpha/FixB family protein [Geopsychrobacter sp.]|nr:electron transfer flavoprotein subunit alpha/FixB family protein [Geopsychrobacter sp.]